jgi:hypothetical protein
MAGNLTAMIASIFSGGVTADPYYEYTTLLLPGSGTNGAQNNTFLDGSTNNFTITRNGNTTQGTFSPFSQTGWGNYFNGSSYLSAGTTLFNYTTGNASTTTFTIEAFIYLNSYQTTANVYHNPCIIGKGDVYLNLGVNGSGNLTFYHFDGTVRSITGSSVIPLATWTYVAVTVTGGTATLYVNGTSVGSGTWYGIQAAGQNTTSLIGRASTNASSLYINGYISNLRVSTVARTIATPTTAYTNDANTALLTAQSNRFIDNSSSPITLTVTGSPTVVAFSPFNPTASWSAATYGGSGYFDGSGDYLSIADNDAFALGSNDWTIECWVYVSSLSSQGFVAQVASNGADASIGFVLGINASGYPYVASYINGAYTAATASTAIVVNQWNHIAGSRASGTMGVFLNGSRLASTAVSGSSVNSTATVTVGASNSGASALTTGYIANARIVNGTAVYSGTTYTVPTAPLTAITNTSLLLNFSNAGIYDATSKNDLETVGNAQISNTTAKWGSTSIKFDGTGDYLQAPDSELIEFGSGDFTIETWVRFAALPSSGAYYTLVSKWDNSTQKSYLWYVYNASGTYQLYFTYTTNGSTNINPVATITPSINTWYHYAVSRSGANLRMFIDGTQVGSTYNIATDTIFGGTYPLQVGASTGANTLNGYMQDVRVTKGYARYTANFTAPTAAFPTL